jgi:hypothetical protein
MVTDNADGDADMTTYAITENMTTNNLLNNVSEFCRVNRGFDGKISASDQRKIWGENVFGRKSIRVEGRGVIRVYMTCNPRGDEIVSADLSHTGRVFATDAGWWGGKDLPQVGDVWW